MQPPSPALAGRHRRSRPQVPSTGVARDRCKPKRPSPSPLRRRPRGPARKAGVAHDTLPTVPALDARRSRGRAAPDRSRGGRPSGLAGMGGGAFGVRGIVRSRPAVDLGPANETIQLPSVADLQKAYNAVFDYYNAAGGVQCRKLVPKYYSDNVLDVSSEQAACLQMQQDKVFAVFNNLFTPQEQTC